MFLCLSIYWGSLNQSATQYWGCNELLMLQKPLSASCLTSSSSLEELCRSLGSSLYAPRKAAGQTAYSLHLLPLPSCFGLQMFSRSRSKWQAWSCHLEKQRDEYLWVTERYPTLSGLHKLVSILVFHQRSANSFQEHGPEAQEDLHSLCAAARLQRLQLHLRL